MGKEFGKSQKSVHAGHRERLREKLLKTDDKDILPHEILEAMLFYAVPRVNTNPHAHHLMEAFGSIDAILNASTEELTKTDGIGKGTAQYLALLGKLARVSEYTKPIDIKFSLGNERTVRYLKELFPDMNREMVYVLGLDKYGYIKSKCVAVKGGFETVEVDVGDIAKCALDMECARLICVHNHPSGISKASESDREVMTALMSALKFLKMELYDSLIVTSDSIYSMMTNKLFALCEDDI